MCVCVKESVWVRELVYQRSIHVIEQLLAAFIASQALLEVEVEHLVHGLLHVRLRNQSFG